MYSKEKTKQNWDSNTKQINFLVNLLEKARRGYFGNLNIRGISGKFCKTSK